MNMNKKNLFAVLIIAALAAVVLIFGLSFRDGAKTALVQDKEIKEAISTASEPSEETAAEDTFSSPEPAADPVQENTSSASEAPANLVDEYFEKFPAESYLLVTTANSIFAPIPLTEDGSFKVTQADGSENVIHIGKNSFYMASSNCDNQNCVGEGEVTLENKDTRILFNMVLCLPHELSLELLTPDEARSVLTELYAVQESEVIADAAE